MTVRYFAAAAVLLVASTRLFCPAGIGQQAPRAPAIRPDVLAQVEKELARLDVQADAEQTQVTPSPSRAVAFYMLAGLAASTSPVRDVPKDDQGVFGIDSADGKTNGKLFAVTKEVRIAFVDKRLRDPSGWYVLRFATLYRHKQGSWVKQGWGHVIPVD
jgi:hypothetical protein